MYDYKVLPRVRNGQALQRRIPARKPGTSPRAAAARKLLTLICYGLRDGQIRALAACALAEVPGP
jgi:hypothetical protein